MDLKEKQAEIDAQDTETGKYIVRSSRSRNEPVTFGALEQMERDGFFRQVAPSAAPASPKPARKRSR